MSSDSNPTCEFVFDVAEWEATHDSESPLRGDETELDDGRWECPHAAISGTAYCPFHHPSEAEPSDDARAAAVLRAVRDLPEGTDRSTRRRRRQFIGARFGSLRLDSVVLDTDDNYPLDFRHATFESFELTNVRIEHAVDLRAIQATEPCTFDGRFAEIRADGARCSTVILDGATLDRFSLADGELDQLSAEGLTADHLDLSNLLADRIAVDHAKLERVHLEEAVAETASFRFSTVEMCDFDEAVFEMGNFYFASFEEADFREVHIADAVFKDTSFDGAYFNNVTFGVANFIHTAVDRAHFSGATLGESSFYESEFTVTADFAEAHVGWANFQNCRFAAADFTDATLEQVSFRESTFERAEFRDVDIAGGLNLKDVTVTEDLFVRPSAERPPGDAVVSLRRGTVRRGRLEQPPDGVAVYDFADATLGTVGIFGPSGTNLLPRLRFYRTRFDEFDYRDHDDIDLATTQFEIHSLDPDLTERVPRLVSYGLALASARQAQSTDTAAFGPPRDSEAYDDLRERAAEHVDSSDSLPPLWDPPDTAGLESTYLYAKNGATKINDNQSASEFFKREMRFRRERYAELASGATTTSEWFTLRWQWFGNLVLDSVAGYGEQPSRVVVTSVVSVVGFAVLYAILAPSLYDNSLNYGVLSVGSFVTLLLGPVASVSLPHVSLLSQVEAFVGAFLIALFVFTLTRSIHR